MFLFSSRRRHTRWPRDWSSDVCSSDLLDLAVRWAEELDIRERHGSPLAREREDVAQSRIFLATARPTLALQRLEPAIQDRKSTRLNSSHVAISYAVFCLKKKKKTQSTI